MEYLCGENITIHKSVCQRIEFDEEEISLQLQVTGSISLGDWKLECLVNPVVRYSSHVCVYTIIVC